MQIVESYLRQVGFWLPRGQQRDIVAELSEEIRTQIEESEARLGRPLTEDEVMALLERWGNPLLVAERYLPQQHLIGPALFPVYLFFLKGTFLWYLLPWLLVWIGIVCFSPAFRAAHPGASLIGTLAPWWSQTVCTVGLLTLLFAYLDRRFARSHVLERWKPEHAFHRKGFGYEWRSKANLFGWPLVHIAIGRDQRGRRRVARGVIAIGQFGVGVVTIAQFGIGLLAGIGQFVLAPFALGQFAIGIVVVGQFALGVSVLGQFAAGLRTLGFPIRIR